MICQNLVSSNIDFNYSPHFRYSNNSCQEDSRYKGFAPQSNFAEAPPGL